MSPNPQETADLVTFTEEILNGKLRFFCAVSCNLQSRTKLMKPVKKSCEIAHEQKT